MKAGSKRKISSITKEKKRTGMTQGKMRLRWIYWTKTGLRRFRSLSSFLTPTMSSNRILPLSPTEKLFLMNTCYLQSKPRITTSTWNKWSTTPMPKTRNYAWQETPSISSSMVQFRSWVHLRRSSLIASLFTQGPSQTIRPRLWWCISTQERQCRCAATGPTIAEP